VTEGALLRPGETCWRIEPATRVKVLVADQDYFAALSEALSAARRSILILGWAFDPRTRLAPDGGWQSPASDEIGRTLIALADANPELDVRVLIWRSALPISATQHFFPHRAKAWFRHSKVKFRLDAEVPFGACHHQKVVVIDDVLAFCGSGDLTGDRWDSQAHPDVDARRMTPDGVAHAPRHEVTAMVEGLAARALGDLARSRWALATGEILDPVGPCGSDPWPDGATPDLTGATVAIARTLPDWRGQRGVREISALTTEAIAAAREFVYLENQYFTAPVIVEALAARLLEPDGPAVVLVSSLHSPSYFDRLTMDRARVLALRQLGAADVFSRFHALAPLTARGAPITVHSKVMIVDDRFARISSANLNNRSGGFDTECEVVLEAQIPEQQEAIAALVDRLMGHWIGRPAEVIARARANRRRLASMLAPEGRLGRLVSLEPAPLGRLGNLIAVYHLGDPTEAADAWRPIGRRHRLYGRDSVP
jgi:phosphatidylserine/phosphatidylglycerophosphate/cardiolipin synthase-like enzyme